MSAGAGRPVAVEPSPEGVPGAVTDPSGVVAEDLTYAGASGADVVGYLARPAAAGTHPGMIVIHEAGGLGAHIKDVANRFAAAGYVTLAVDLYSRYGGPPPMDDVPKLMERLFSMSDADAIGDLQGAREELAARPDCSGRIGVIGFCMGGRYTLLFACAGTGVDAAVDCWGGFIDRATFEERVSAARPTPPLDLADGLRCPLFAAIGAEDSNPSPEIGEQLRERAGASGKEVEVVVYEGAGHAFFADHRPMYRPEPATRLWAEVLPFLARHLGG